MPLTATLARLPKVSDTHKEAMFTLHSRHFCNVTREGFFRDMDEKDWVIILRDGDEIAGFSTLKLIRMPVAGTERIFLFSGDTIVDPAHWQDSKLAGTFGHFMLRLLAEYGDLPLHWILISKGYRTYRFLPVYFKQFYPSFDRRTPAEHTELMQAVAIHKFQDAYDLKSGLIRFGGQKDRLTPKLCVVQDSRRNDPHVRFFLERNPDFALGDELVCIADISRDNLNKYAWRVIQSTTVVWDE